MKRLLIISAEKLLIIVGLSLVVACSADPVHTIYRDHDGSVGEGGIDDASLATDTSVTRDANGYFNGGHSGNGNGNGGSGDEDDSGILRPNDIVDWDMSCASETQSVELTPLDMIIVLDTSYSMDYLGKWPAVKQAINIFAADPSFAGLGVGIQYFPIRKECSAPDYADLSVEVDVLPDNMQNISDSLDSQRMSGGTPMAPMLEGVLSYAQQRVEDNPDRNVVIVVATDGIPDTSCLSDVSGSSVNTLENVVALAEEGAAADPGVSTFVVGVGTELTALNEIALAGSGADAFFVDTSADIQQVFLDALTEIRRRSLACEHPVPEVSSSVEIINPDKVNVVFTTDDEEEVFYRVADKSTCDKIDEHAWYYDDPDDPSKIVLCPEACDHVQAFAEGVFDVLFGCDGILY